MKKLALILFFLHLTNINLHAQKYYSRMFDLFHSWEDAGNLIDYNEKNQSITILGRSINPYDLPDSLKYGLAYTSIIDSNGNATFHSILAKDTLIYGSSFRLYNKEKNHFIISIQYGHVRNGKVYYKLVGFNTNGDTIATIPFECGDLLANFLMYKDNKYYVFGQDGWLSGSPLSVLCMDTLGKKLWYKVYPEKRSLLFGVAFDDSNNFILSGGIYQAPNNNDSIWGWYAKMDTAGNFIWDKVQDYNLYIFSGVPYLVGNTIYLIGANEYWNQPCYNHISKIDAAGNMIWHKKIQDGYFSKYNIMVNDLSIATYKNNHFYGCGLFRMSDDSGNIYTDVMQFAKFDTLGNIKWRRTFRQWEIDNTAFSITAVSDGFIILGTAVDTTHTTGYSDAWVIKTDTNGCIVPGCNSKDGMVQIINPEKLFKVYPNPAKEIVNVEVIAPNTLIKNISIYNNQAQMVLSQNSISQSSVQSISVSSLPNGYYTLVIELQDGSQAAKKIIIEK
jgi:hypothetical protein